MYQIDAKYILTRILEFLSQNMFFLAYSGGFMGGWQGGGQDLNILKLSKHYFGLLFFISV